MPLSLRETSPLPPFTFAQSTSPLQNGHSPPSKGTNPTEYILGKDQNLFGAQLLVIEPGKALLKCNKCSKIVTEAAGAEHTRVCNHILNGVPLSNKKSGKKAYPIKRRASEASEEMNSPLNKKQKLPGDHVEIPPLPSFKNMKKSDIKKVKKERERLEKKAAKVQAKNDAQERKRMRASEPIDLDRQCGVINDKNLPCSRSLTCKTHTVGAKRSVEGRSKAYDSLYLEWQRANNPNFKEPQKPGRKEKTESEKKKPGRKKWSEFNMNVSGGDHEGIGEGEEGQREFEEMIMFARIGGDRCRSLIGGFGGGWDTMPSGQVRAAKGSASVTASASASKRPSGTVGIAPATKSINPTNSNGTNGTIPIAPAGGVSVSVGVNPALVATPVNKGTIPFSLDAIFRTAMNEYNGVGDTMTKALATRTGENHPPIQSQPKLAKPRANNRQSWIPQEMNTGGDVRPNEVKQPAAFTVAA